MLAELNDSFAILRDPARRNAYDRSRSSATKPKQTSAGNASASTSRSPSFKRSDLTAGQVRFADLPKNIQQRLLERQSRKIEDQVQVKLPSVGPSIAWIVVLLCWFVYLFGVTNGAKWTGETQVLYALVSLAVGGFIGHNAVRIGNGAMATLKPYFYVTPMYFIRTEQDIVSFRPIWTLSDISATHNYRNGTYQNTHVVLKFDNHAEALVISSKDQVDVFYQRLKAFDERLRTAFARGEHESILAQDDFQGVQCVEVPTPTALSVTRRALIYGSCTVLAAVGLTGGIYTNELIARDRWMRHPEPSVAAVNPAPTAVTPAPTPVAPVPKREIAPSIPEQPMPRSGSAQFFSAKKNQAPFEIKTSRGGYYLVLQR